jgi:hypothetical protein
MKLRNALIGALVLAIGSFALAPVAGAAVTGGTAGTFTITAGGLAITVPASAAFANVNTGAASTSGALGAVSVTDTRGSAVALWTTTVTSTVFGTGPSANETVALADISYASGLSTASSGIGAFVPSLSTAMTATPVVRWTAGIGNNSATWNPTVTFALLGSQVAGVYTGTITHSVA